MKRNTLLFLLLSFSIYSYAQLTIKGTVMTDSIPLESTNVIIKNSKKGTATDVKGQFKIEAKKGDTLSISYLGYKSKEFVLNNSLDLKVELEVNNSLDEVVVVAYSSHSYCRSTSCGVCITYVHYWNNQNQKNKLFPNPSSSGIFQLKLVEDYNEVIISVSNMSGRIIQDTRYLKYGNKLSVDLSQFSTGIYIINIIGDGERLQPIKAIIS